MSIDPLAEEYAYNSTYAFQENKMGMGRELEGLELAPFEWLDFGLFMSETTKPTIIETLNKPEIIENFNKIEEHHVIPKALKENELVKQARDDGFEFEGRENKIPLEKYSRLKEEGRHGNHPKYTETVKNLLKEGNKEGVTPKDFVRNLVRNLKDEISNNPDKKINDLFKSTTIDATSTKKIDVTKTIIRVPEIKKEKKKEIKLNEQV